ncbi:M23 family metallopeptidase [Paenibacillus eucommiae]|uniref:Murein DD-endopeptidase MepM/ murein hydrolase activator NlpD n=1 Tax=Paenibacillus eucommiae TaxID=1355755 RepID=A0ABS4J163_9BACL|nr:M23 family metallopeptidase [Paenibacillus eucommiae]MBP1993070.1 murein DD-endopeptidase MepM/ murein hydrolase activator NlpD [Paenibacillus eucommiae]
MVNKVSLWMKIAYAVLFLFTLLSVLEMTRSDFGLGQNQRLFAAENPEVQKKNIFAERKDLLEEFALVSKIPWYELAAIDQYERSLISAKKKGTAQPQGLIAIQIPEAVWAGPLNPDQADTNPMSIAWFGGIGKDGSGDGKADRSNDLDLLQTMVSKITKSGNRDTDRQIGLWAYYQNTRSVQRIKQFSEIYKNLEKLDLFEHAFPLPLSADYSYRSTWGAKRGWGGFRTHEGTDLFARYGVPVRSTCYGIVELIGWNNFGGWRVGIRDLTNTYHYYAHLSGFAKNLKQGDIVKPGQTVGWVGSSGYGKPGTSGKFPPHLHYGLYRDTGLNEWSFNPYPYLKNWEREEQKNRTKSAPSA